MHLGRMSDVQLAGGESEVADSTVIVCGVCCITVLHPVCLLGCCILTGHFRVLGVSLTVPIVSCLLRPRLFPSLRSPYPFDLVLSVSIYGWFMAESLQLSPPCHDLLLLLGIVQGVIYRVLATMIMWLYKMRRQGWADVAEA